MSMGYGVSGSLGLLHLIRRAAKLLLLFSFPFADEIFNHLTINQPLILQSLQRA